jgi:hypothetical protein
MKTDDLIASLAADQSWRPQPVWLWLLAGLVATLPVSVAVFMMTLGVRPDIGVAMYHGFFDFKFVVTLALASCTAVLVIHMSRPEASLKGWIWLLAIPAGLLGIAIAVDLTIEQRSTWAQRMVGTNAMVCFASIPLISAPLLAGALVTLRHGATTQPGVAGALAGLLSAGVGATLYASHCADDSPLFVATWYTLAALLVAGAGALIGSRVLKL